MKVVEFRVRVVVDGGDGEWGSHGEWADYAEAALSDVQLRTTKSYPRFRRIAAQARIEQIDMRFVRAESRHINAEQRRSLDEARDREWREAEGMPDAP